MAEDDRVAFTLGDARRIGRVVRSAEVQRTDISGKSRRRIQPSVLVAKLVKLNAALEAGQSAEATVWLSTSTSAAPAATTVTVTVWDWLMSSGYRLPADTKCIVSRIPGHPPRWYAVAASTCPTTST